MRQQLDTLLVGSTFSRINVADIKALVIIVPPRAEQDAIAKQLDSELAEAAHAQSLAKDEISLLREYRTRLVADVVTGKVDVREAATRLSSAVDCDEPSDDFIGEEGESEMAADEVLDGLGDLGATVGQAREEEAI
jgi:type I restriction enzyme S subunit